MLFLWLVQTGVEVNGNIFSPVWTGLDAFTVVHQLTYSLEFSLHIHNVVYLGVVQA